MTKTALAIIYAACLLTSCSGDPHKKASDTLSAEPAGIESWLTSADQSLLLQKQTAVIPFTKAGNNNPFIGVDTSQSFQQIDGFGYTLTGGSAELINRMEPAAKGRLLKELFGKGSSAIGVSYLRISIGASDLNAYVFSYDDMPAGQTDTGLAHFNLGPDKINLTPLLKEILGINPNIKILATPWSPPAWMKDNNSSIGGSLKPVYYGVYARYFVKYIQQMKAEGINIDAITPQNEPLHPGNNPSMLMLAEQQADFISNHLGPAFRSAGLTTKIIIYDHNCDKPDYPLSILADAAAKPFIDGSAFHLYAGDISVLSDVHHAFPDKKVYFTEQYTASNSSFGEDLKWHVKNLIIGAARNWSSTVLEWNLANDPAFGPHTPGGCTTCKGALTINGSGVTRNSAYYVIAHASKFVPAGSVRIGSDTTANLPNVAFKTPEGKKALIVLNEGKETLSFNIRYNNRWAAAQLAAGSVGSFVW